MRPAAKLAAYSQLPPVPVEIASPLKMAPGTVATLTAIVLGERPACHASIEPCSDAKMKRAGAPPTMKPEPPANACPVGARSGIATVRGTFANGTPVVPPRYSVVESEPLSETHKGVAGPKLMPHALTRLASTIGAQPGTFETRFV